MDPNGNTISESRGSRGGMRKSNSSSSMKDFFIKRFDKKRIETRRRDKSGNVLDLITGELQ